MKLIDVSVPLDAALATYPDNLPFSLEAIKRLSRGDSSNVSALHMSAHAGTHVDAPRHFFDEGTGTEALPLEMLIGRARVIEAPTARRHHGRGSGDGRPLGRRSRAHQDAELPALGRSRISHRTSSASPNRARSIWSITASRWSASTTCRWKCSRRPVRRRTTCCSARGTIVIEGLNLRDVDPGVYEMLCLPLRVVGSDGAPARVVLRRS